jgi:hypothetical protein
VEQWSSWQQPAKVSLRPFVINPIWGFRRWEGQGVPTIWAGMAIPAKVGGNSVHISVPNLSRDGPPGIQA